MPLPWEARSLRALIAEKSLVNEVDASAGAVLVVEGRVLGLPWLDGVELPPHAATPNRVNAVPDTHPGCFNRVIAASFR